MTVQAYFGKPCCRYKKQFNDFVKKEKIEMKNYNQSFNSGQQKQKKISKQYRTKETQRTNRLKSFILA